MTNFKALSATLVLFSTLCSSHANAFLPTPKITNEDARETLRGSLAYLEAMQIRQRPGKESCERDASSGDGCDRAGVLNIEGEWSNHIQALPLIPNVPVEGERLILYDSNMFVTTAIMYPLYWVQDKKNLIQTTRDLAMKSVLKYKRGEAYSFWPQLTSQQTGNKIVGPINLRFDKAAPSDYSGLASFFSRVIGKFFPWVQSWMTEILNTSQNPDGMQSFFNVPNDADDTAMATAILKLHNRESNQTGPLRVIVGYRDQNRTKSDPRDHWTPKDSGAYLTWLKDERSPTFASPNEGVMPMGVNNVDCVVNANVLFSLALNGLQEAPGFHESADYLADVVTTRSWLDGSCALYYPQRYTFPYSLTRAFRDAGASSPKLNQAMDKLMIDLLKEQYLDGHWYIKTDGTSDYSTALALVSLLNLGEKRAIKLNIEKDYNRAIQKALSYLHYHKDLLPSDSGLGANAYRWQSGLFFSAEEPQLGTWRSAAITNAIVAEAFAKYLMGYHRTGDSLLTNQSGLRYLIEVQ
jgi:hypothetical protein